MHARHKFILFCLLAAALVVGCSGRSSAEPDKPEKPPKRPSTYSGPAVVLEPGYVAGHYRVSTRQHQQQEIKLGTREQTQETELLMIQRATVSKPDAAGNQTLTLTYTRIRQTQSMGAGSLQYDSEGPAESNNPLLTKIFQPMLGAELTVTVGPDGHIQKVKGMDAIWDKVSAALGPQAQAGVDSLKKQMGNETISQMMEMGRRLLPQKPVQPGDLWEATTRLKAPMIGQLTTTAHSRLQDIEQTPAGRIAVIESLGQASSEGGSRSVGQVDVRVHELNLDQHMMIRFNVDSGMVTSQELEQSGPISMTMTGPEGNSRRVTVQQKMTLKTEWEKLDSE
jgi:hypothetical protein